MPLDIDNNRAAYRVLDPAGFFSDDDTLYIADAAGNAPMIYFDGEPNEQLEPLNELAKQRLETYLNKLDNLARITADKLNRPFVGRARSLDGALDIATEVERARVPLMGNTKEKTATTQKIEPAQKDGFGKKKRGRPVGTGTKKLPALIAA